MRFGCLAWLFHWIGKFRAEVWLETDASRNKVKFRAFEAFGSHSQLTAGCELLVRSRCKAKMRSSGHTLRRRLEDGERQSVYPCAFAAIISSERAVLMLSTVDSQVGRDPCMARRIVRLLQPQ